MIDNDAHSGSSSVLDRRPGLGTSGLRAPATLCTGQQQTQTSRGQCRNGVIAAPVDPDPRVGAVFLGGGDLHACTGSVLHSATGNLVLTAAHCMIAGGPATFVPGFAGEAAPTDIWTMDVIYLDPRWVANKDPQADYAIARVSRADGGSVEAQVGSALSLGSAPAKGSRMTWSPTRPASAACPLAVRPASESVTMATRSCRARAWPMAPAARRGSAARTVTGVIGGLYGGGCAESLSYSSPFDQHITELLARAEAGGPGDVPTAAFDDAC